MRYYFHPEALEEYADVTSYYADILPELAEAFIYEIEKGISLILDHPRAWPIVEEDIRRHLIGRFPFGVYYTIEDDNSIMIVAIMHMSREPGYWKSRLYK